MPTVLSLDTTSPRLGVCVARDGELLAGRRAPQRSASERLLSLIEEVLGESETDLDHLDGLVALRGPGSFTGIRIGLATALGIHRATGLPSVGWSTLEVLARAPGPCATGGAVLALVHALRRDWYSQLFESSGDPSTPEARESPQRRAANEVLALDVERIVVGDSDPIETLDGLDPHRAVVAEVAARTASERAPIWDPGSLSKPLYVAPPPASRPRPPKPVVPPSR